MLKEDGQACGDSKVSLFGNNNHMSVSEIEKLELTQSEFRQNRLTTMTPNVLSFGTHHCHSIAYYQVDFVSAKDNKRHELMKKVAAPIDKRQHTYRLQWQSDSDLYQIM